MRNLILAIAITLLATVSFAGEDPCYSEELIGARAGVITYCDNTHPTTPNRLTIVFRQNGEIDPLQTYLAYDEGYGFVEQIGPNYTQIGRGELGDLFQFTTETISTQALPSCYNNDLFPLSCTGIAAGDCGLHWWGAPKAVFVQRVTGSEVVTCRYQCESGGPVKYFGCRFADPDPPIQPDPCPCTGQPTCDCDPVP